MKKLPVWMTTVTPLSKVLAAIVFILLPFAGFLAGIEVTQPISHITTSNVYSTSKVSIVTPTEAVKDNDGRSNGDTFYIPDLDISVQMPSGWKIAILNYGYGTCESYKYSYKIPTDCKGSVKDDAVFAYNDPTYTAKFDANGVIENYPKQYFVLRPFTGKQNLFTLCDDRGIKCGDTKELSTNILNNVFNLTYEDKNFIGYSNSTAKTGSNSIFLNFQISEIKANDNAGLDTIKQILQSTYTGK